MLRGSEFRLQAGFKVFRRSRLRFTPMQDFKGCPDCLIRLKAELQTLRRWRRNGHAPQADHPSTVAAFSGWLLRPASGRWLQGVAHPALPPHQRR